MISLQHTNFLLERIAEALERIANELEMTRARGDIRDKPGFGRHG